MKPFLQEPTTREVFRDFKPVAKRADYVHCQQQQRAVVLLLVGALCGFLGFLFATIIGLSNWTASTSYALNTTHPDPKILNYRGEVYASRNPYRPQTVSEMVMDPREPSGKAFFGFCLIGAICMLASWYPWELRNVYLGDDRYVCCPSCPTILNVRTFLPPIGMLLVACVPTTPPVDRSFGDSLTGMIHTAGAVLMIGGYCLCEIYTLLVLDKDDDEEEGPLGQQKHFAPGEKPVRWVLIVLSLLCGITFQVMGVVATNMASGAHEPDSCWDQYVVPTMEDYTAVEVAAQQPGKEYLLGIASEMTEYFKSGDQMLKDTASGACYIVKALEFWFEVASGVFMLFSHFAIWWFCPERHINLDNELPPLVAMDNGWTGDVREDDELPEF